ncbi:tail fiber assembly protein [Pseudomonas sp. P2758]|uniref:tail fiber assembly protein n=1 Tax=unclassified Pseudomonas TaxID=196821 RepID=UPI003B591DC6
MAYAITAIGWRGVDPDTELAPGETLVEEVPGWLVSLDADRERVASAKSQLDTLRATANEVLSPLQAGVDIDEISDDDRVLWKAWKRYLIALSKTLERPGWPDTPDWPALPDPETRH